MNHLKELANKNSKCQAVFNLFWKSEVAATIIRQYIKSA